MLDLFFVRHAESEMNQAPGIICGRSSSTPLSKKGLLQASKLGARFKNSGTFFDKIYSSPARRTLQTAELITQKIGADVRKIITSDGLQELHQGDWEGQPRDKIYTPEILNEISRSAGTFCPPNGESMQMVENRMINWLKTEFPDDLNSEIKALIVTHGMAISCLLRGILDSAPSMIYKTRIDNTSITRLKKDEKGWHLLGVNDSAHIQ